MTDPLYTAHVEELAMKTPVETEPTPGLSVIEQQIVTYKHMLSQLIDVIEKDYAFVSVESADHDVLYQFRKDTKGLMAEYIHTESLLKEGMV
jgi:hypothetical protein